MRSPAEMTKTRRLALTGMLCAAAFALSCLERAVPVGALIPLPGVRLGLGNISILLAFSLLGKAEGAAVAAVKVLLSFFLFGSPVSLLLSATGTALSFAALMLCSLIPGGKISFIGASALSAAAHASGQVAAAALAAGSAAVVFYLPVLLLFSLAAGTVSGALLNLALGRILKPEEGRIE